MRRLRCESRDVAVVNGWTIERERIGAATRWYAFTLARSGYVCCRQEFSTKRAATTFAKAQPFFCDACTYPSRRALHCDNPACEANPDVTQAQKDAWRAIRERNAAEEGERERVRRIRRRMLNY